MAQCRSDLSSDEEIFAEKARELSQANERAGALRDDNERLARRLSDAEHQCAHLEGQLLAKQIELDKMAARMQASGFIAYFFSFCLNLQLGQSLDMLEV